MQKNHVNVFVKTIAHLSAIRSVLRAVEQSQECLNLVGTHKKCIAMWKSVNASVEKSTKMTTILASNVAMLISLASLVNFK